MLGDVQIEHELRQRTLQPRKRTANDDESRAAELRSRLEVERAGRAQIDVILRRKIQLGRLAPGAQHNVGFFVDAVRHAAIGNIRNGQEQIVELSLRDFVPRFGGIQTRPQISDFCQQRRNVAPGSLGLSDRLRFRVAFVLQTFGFEL